MYAPGQYVDRYLVEDRVVEDATSTLYKVRHTLLGSVHALEVLAGDRPAVAERVLQGARDQAALRHPNIVAITDILHVGGQVALVMEWIDGPTLEHWMSAGAADGPAALAVLRGVARGLRHAHQNGTAHGALDVSRVVIGQVDGRPIPKVGAFGRDTNGKFDASDLPGSADLGAARRRDFEGLGALCSVMATARFGGSRTGSDDLRAQLKTLGSEAPAFSDVQTLLERLDALDPVPSGGPDPTLGTSMAVGGLAALVDAAMGLPEPEPSTPAFAAPGFAVNLPPVDVPHAVSPGVAHADAPTSPHPGPPIAASTTFIPESVDDVVPTPVPPAPTPVSAPADVVAPVAAPVPAPSPVPLPVGRPEPRVALGPGEAAGDLDGGSGGDDLDWASPQEERPSSLRWVALAALVVVLLGGGAVVWMNSGGEPKEPAVPMSRVETPAPAVPKPASPPPEPEVAPESVAEVAAPEEPLPATEAPAVEPVVADPAPVVTPPAAPRTSGRPSTPSHAQPVARPAPATVVEPTVAAAPAADVAKGHLTVTGDAETVWIQVAGSWKSANGSFASGTYPVRAKFPGADPVAAGTVTVEANKNTTLKCSSFAFQCK